MYKFFQQGFQQAANHPFEGRRIGAELKFPLVQRQTGKAASLTTVNSLWQHLAQKNWNVINDPLTHKPVGASKPGEFNHTVAGYAIGFCNLEFALAHTGDLHALEQQINALVTELAPFADAHDVSFLGYGIQPVTEPTPEYRAPKQRTLFDWNAIFPREYLFTVSAQSHVHLSISFEEAIPATNILNGFAGAQIALMANSSIWKGNIDDTYQSVTEKIYDWWIPDGKTVGIPRNSFNDLESYADFVANLSPVFVYRNQEPILINHYSSFADYFERAQAIGYRLSGEEMEIEPLPEDEKLHNSFYWFTARISRYFTMENRLWDQQPPGDLICPAALSLGLLSALNEAQEELSHYDWLTLKLMREAALQKGLAGRVEGIAIADLAKRMLELATLGLKRRGLGEEKFLESLQQRLLLRQNPAMIARDLFNKGGIPALVEDRDICRYKNLN
ncbi:glutamate-cysteine ligase family protein [Coleofasciculus sp. F4-SAH-05]|uniref:glutamate-cysteine ligase family protein n=1 Tax=Coleofasciculus sp. F4-SAH-05 TaxID=3069525 RepID=UPI0032FCBD20